MRSWVLTSALALALLGGGCAQLREAARAGAQEPPSAPGDAIEPAADSAALLAYFARVRQLPAAELARERERARRAVPASGGDEQRIRYAMTLSVPLEGSVDAARAIEVLDPVTRRRDSPVQPLAITLRALLSELAQAQRELAQAQRERAELQRMLDSLKALEQSLSNREKGRQ